MRRVSLLVVFAAVMVAAGAWAGESCIECHTKISPGQVQDWRVSKHAENDVTCSTCHGEEHSSAEDYELARLPDETVCGECHETQFEQFSRGKHNFGWTAMNAIPATHFALSLGHG